MKFIQNACLSALISVSCCVCVSGSLFAADTPETVDKTDNGDAIEEVKFVKKGGPDDRRFIPLEPSFLLLPQHSQTYAGEEDQRALEARFSFQYIIFNCEFTFFPSRKCKTTQDTVVTSLSYTGEFDFYMGTRESGPVINRISNPALNLTYETKEEKWKTDFISVNHFGVSLEHRSNGQVIDVNKRLTDPTSPDNGKFLTQIAYESGDIEYFDELSRGADYLNFKSKFQIGKGSTEERDCDSTIWCVDMQLHFKHYFRSDSNITWGELAGSSLRIWDYDRLRLILTNEFEFPMTEHPVQVDVDYTMGDRLSETDSVDINIITPLLWRGLNFPLLIRYHSGPMDRLSDYTRGYKSIGIGIYLSD